MVCECRALVKQSLRLKFGVDYLQFLFANLDVRIYCNNPLSASDFNPIAGALILLVIVFWLRQ